MQKLDPFDLPPTAVVDIYDDEDRFCLFEQRQVTITILPKSPEADSRDNPVSVGKIENQFPLEFLDFMKPNSFLTIRFPESNMRLKIALTSPNGSFSPLACYRI
ncbi:MAG TPA: hypothetical protein VFG11_00530 [Acidobacteriota bacterium]|nr:hypothetical protein [Acidobacteriota bacterium]